MRILAADDSKTVLYLLKAVLEREGHEVITAEDGFEAIEKIFFEKPQLAILDVEMPKFNGYQLTKFIKSEGGLNSLPIIILTSHSTAIDKYWGYKSGADAYLEKPFEPSKLLSEIKKITTKFPNVVLQPEKSVFGKKIYQLLQKIKNLRKDPLALRLRENELAVLLFSYLNERLDKSLIRLSLIKEISELVSKTTDLNIFVKEVLYKLAKLFDYTIGMLYLKSAHKSQLFIQCRGSITENFLRNCRQESLDICEKEGIYHKTDNLSVKIVEMDEFLYGDYKEEVKFFKYKPLQMRDIKIGGLFLFSKVPISFYQESEDFLDIFIQQIAILIDNVILVEKLKRYGDEKAIKLSAIYEIGKILGTSFETQNFFSLILDNVINVMKIKRASIMLIDEKKKLIVYNLFRVEGKTIFKDNMQEEIKEDSITGWILKNKKPLLVEDIRLDPRFSSFMRDDYSTYSFISVPIIVQGKLEGIVNVTDKLNGENFNIEDLDMMVLLSNQIAKNIENQRLYQELAEKERLDKELEIARNIQMSWLPQGNSPQLEKISVYGWCEPAKEMSGDYFDYLSYDSKSFSFVIGDASGKGVPASLAVVMMRSALKMGEISTQDPSIILERLNKLLIENMDPDMFATAFLGRIDFETGILEYSNGGHEHPLVYKASLDQLMELEGNGILLGMFPQVEYKLYREKLEPGDLLLLYTDGAVDITNSEGEKFGINNLKRLLRKNVGNSPKNVINNILQELKEFQGNEKQFDDITLMCIRINDN